ncbi:FliM/FliN family flagellar motor switch protein [Profundibacterium mesophilum]|uniref:Flagellar motor switch protein FliN n=1 Tax=Profundibacterium mesophilum KAUST100406-0324 TaxID=1037889 RepID=A0A921NNX6_9RHOB|nr:FliM/FliN family flagellar motor switch protein [Profundibacterium mesophilum]KAF0674632.1 Flagellar motor switch protein FliN [Profundibacterium mesophilum KAUST100406-0324]
MSDTDNTKTAPETATSKPEPVGDASDVFPEFTADAADTAPPEPSGTTDAKGRNIDAMLNVGLNVQVVLGRSRMPISNLLKLSRGSVIELDKRIGEPVELIINDRLVARGDLVKLTGERIGVSLTEIVKDYINET